VAATLTLADTEGEEAVAVAAPTPDCKTVIGTIDGVTAVAAAATISLTIIVRLIVGLIAVAVAVPTPGTIPPLIAGVIADATPLPVETEIVAAPGTTDEGITVADANAAGILIVVVAARAGGVTVATLEIVGTIRATDP
jgi:hypothetical protein